MIFRNSGVSNSNLLEPTFRKNDVWKKSSCGPQNTQNKLNLIKFIILSVFLDVQRQKKYMLRLIPVLAGCCKAERLPSFPWRLSIWNKYVWRLDKVIYHFISYTNWIRQQVLNAYKMLKLSDYFKYVSTSRRLTR